MKEGEYALSKDADVALWLHHRSYNKLPPLSDNGDFIIVNTELHDDFDDFKSKEIESGYSCLEVNELLQHYLETKLHGVSTVNKYGLKFVHLHASEIDDLCEWVEELQEKYSDIGNDVFITGISDRIILGLCIHIELVPICT